MTRVGSQLEEYLVTRFDRKFNSGTTGIVSPWRSLQSAYCGRLFGEIRSGCGFNPNVGRTDFVSVQCDVALWPGAGSKESGLRERGTRPRWN